MQSVGSTKVGGRELCTALRVLLVLAGRGSWVSRSELARVLHSDTRTVDRALRILLDHGLVTERVEGRYRLYRVTRDATISELAHLLLQ